MFRRGRAVRAMWARARGLDRTRALAAVALCAMVLVLAAAAGGVSGAAGDVAAYVDGARLSCDVPPLIEGGRVLVPMRPIFEALGAGVAWDGATGTVTAQRADVTVRLEVGHVEGWVTRGSERLLYILDVPARIVSGRTMVPLRFVGEALGATVTWNGTTRTVTVTSPGAPPPPPPPTAAAEVHFIDVGQGDCILIRAGADGWALVDGGPHKSEGAVLQYLAAQGVDHLDLVVATHPHEDHIGGLDGVLGVLPASRVIDPGLTSTTSAYTKYLNAVTASGAQYEVARAPATYTVGTGVTLRVLYPATAPGPSADANSASVVCVLTCGQVDVMLTGDLPSTCEAGIATDVEVLKVAHHGSATSTSSTFLQHTTPSDAVISVGAGNSYGHPTPEALARLGAAGANVYRTDAQGTIVLTTDGTTYSFDKAPWASGAAPPGPAKNYAASKKGEKYHYPWCRYVASILPENLIWFETPSQARAAGYAPCSVCSPP